MRQHHVYFLITECERFVKIGISSNVELRLQYIQGHSPLKLKLIKIPCEKKSMACKMETSLHFEFRSYRLHGEWFRYIEAIQKRVKQLSLSPARRKYRRGMPKLATMQDFLQRKETRVE